MPKIIPASFKIETEFDGDKILREMELFARNCYKSEEKVSGIENTYRFVNMLLHTNKHEGILDHHIVSVRVICDRGISLEIVRHRMGAYLQESTRYCTNTHEGEIEVIEIPGLTQDQRYVWESAMKDSEHYYNTLREFGCSPQIARSVLPNSLKTEIIMSLNLRSWRNFFRLRCSSNAHPQMREIAIPLLQEFKRRIPVVFNDL